MKMYRMWSIVLAFVLLVNGCTKSVPEQQRSVSVFGTACVYAEPNEALISLTVATKEMELAAAKQKNDALLQKLRNIVKEFNIDQKYVLLDYSTVNPEYQYRSQIDGRIFTGYSVRQNISIKLTDITRYEPFIAALLNAGIDTIHNTDFTNSELRKHRDTARGQAIQAAIEKAALLCKESSRGNKPVRLGKVLEIREIETARTPTRSAQNLKAKNAMVDEATQVDGHGGLIPLGHIPIQAEIEMIFALE